MEFRIRSEAGDFEHKRPLKLAHFGDNQVKYKHKKHLIVTYLFIKLIKSLYKYLSNKNKYKLKFILSQNNVEYYIF